MNDRSIIHIINNKIYLTRHRLGTCLTYRKLCGSCDTNHGGGFTQLRSGAYQIILDPSINDIEYIFNNITSNGSYGQDMSVVQIGSNRYEVSYNGAFENIGTKAYITYRPSYNNAGSPPSIYINLSTGIEYKIRIGVPNR